MGAPSTVSPPLSPRTQGRRRQRLPGQAAARGAGVGGAALVGLGRCAVGSVGGRGGAAAIGRTLELGSSGQAPAAAEHARRPPPSCRRRRVCAAQRAQLRARAGLQARGDRVARGARAPAHEWRCGGCSRRMRQSGGIGGQALRAGAQRAIQLAASSGQALATRGKAEQGCRSGCAARRASVPVCRMQRPQRFLPEGRAALAATQALRLRVGRFPTDGRRMSSLHQGHKRPAACGCNCSHRLQPQAAALQLQPVGGGAGGGGAGGRAPTGVVSSPRGTPAGPAT